MHLAQELIINIQCSGGSRSFAKETRALKMRSTVAGHWNDDDQLRATIKADPLTTIWEAAEELNVNHSTIVWHLKQTGKVKKLHKLTEKKNHCFWNVIVSFFFHTRRNHFLIGLWHVTKSGFSRTTGQWPTQWLDGGVNKALPKAEFVPKKGHGHCLVVSC